MSVTGEALAALFAPDGEIQVFSRFGQEEEYVALDADVVGREALRTWLRRPLPPGRAMHYPTTDHIVDVTGDEARMHARALGVHAAPGEARPSPGAAAEIVLIFGKRKAENNGSLGNH